MAGALDVFGGTGSVSGVNGFNLDHSPLDQFEFGGALSGTGVDFLDAVTQWLQEVVGPAFQNLTGLVLTGPLEFLESLFALLGNITVDIASIFAALATATGLDFSSPDKFAESLLALIGTVPDLLASVIAALGEITGLDFFHGPLEFLESLVQALITDAQMVVQALCGAFQIDFTPEGFTASLTAILEAVGLNVQQFVDDLVQLGLGLFGINFSSMEKFIESLLALLGGLGGNILELLGQVLHFPDLSALSVDGLMDWVLDTVFGIIPPDRVPVLPISHLVNTSPNLLTNPTFTGEGISGVQSGEWVVDPAEWHVPNSSSARVDCNGADHDLLSIDLIPVAPGQRLEISGWVKTGSLVGAAGCVNINLAVYDQINGSDEPTYVNLSRISQSGSADWEQYSKTWVCPPVGAAAVRVNLSVEKTALSGKVWFDDLFAGKKGTLEIDWVDGLNDEIDAFTSWLLATINSISAGFGLPSIANLEKDFEKLQAAIDAAFGPILGSFGDLFAQIATFLNIDSLIAELERLTGLNFDEGPAKFLESLINEFERLTKLDINAGPQKFIESLVALLTGETGINFANPQALFTSIESFLTNIGITLQEAIAGVAAATGLVLTDPAAFIQSLVNKITAVFGVNLGSPQLLFDSIKGLITTLVESVSATIAEVIKWIKDTIGIDLSAGLNFFQSFAAQLTLSPVQLSHLDISGPGSFTNIGAGVTTAIGNIEATWTQWLQALTGRVPTTSSAELTAEQIEQLIATTTANNTMLANIQASLTAAGTAGMSGGDEFELGTTAALVTTAAGWTGQGWQEVLTGAGRFQINDRHQADWVGGAAGQEARYFRTAVKDAKTLTPYQRVTRVTGSKAAQTFVLNKSADLLFGRVNDARTQYVVAGANSDGVYLKYKTGGAEVLALSAAAPAPTVGCSYTLECGTVEGVRVYRIIRNGAVVLLWNDTSGVTATLDANRGWGWGGITASALLGTLLPSSVNSVTVTDNFPSPYIGTYLRAYRGVTAGVVKPNGDNPLANNTFTVASSSQDLIFDTVSQEIVVLKAGPLNVSARLEFNADIQGTERWDLLLYKRSKAESVSTIFARGAQQGGVNGLSTDSQVNAVSGAFSVYCNVGDVLELGAGNNMTAALVATQKSVVGDGGGTRSWITITRGG